MAIAYSAGTALSSCARARGANAMPAIMAAKNTQCGQPP